MAISADYPRPVTVNGFTCRNCTEVDEAKKHIDPAHPKDGPYGVNAAQRENNGAKTAARPYRPPVVVFGGQLAGLAPSGAFAPSSGGPRSTNAASGSQVDISA